MLKLNFDPDLSDVGTAFFARKVPIVEETVGAVEVSSLGEVQNEFEDKWGRSCV